MEMNYTFFYVEANIICIIIFAMMFFREMRSVDRQTKQLLFINIMVCHILYFVSDIVWVLILADYIPHNQLSTSIVNYSNAVLLSALTGFWFVYVELSQGEKYLVKARVRVYTLIPAMAETVVMLLLFVMFPGVVMDEKGNVTPVYYVVFLAVPIFYIIISSVRGFIRAMRRENFAVRGQYIACAIYPLIISFFGILQVIWLSAPLFCFGCSIMMLYVYVIRLNDQVSIDELTKLNNRTQLKKYITNEHSRQGTDKIARYVLMIDLNKFKSINDQYGHIEGDNALRRTADALKFACGENTLKTFIARYGGDEFIIIAKTSDEELVKTLCDDIKNTLIRLNKEAGSKYELTACIGYAGYSGDLEDFQTALSEADEALYKEKAARSGAKRS